MAIERENLQNERGYNPYRDQILGQRGTDERHPAETLRENEAQTKALEIQKAQNPLLQRVAQVAFITSGVYMLGRTRARDALRSALDALGYAGRSGLRVAREGARSAVRGAVGSFPETRSLERAFHGVDDPEIRNLELIDTLEGILNFRRTALDENGFARGLRASRAGGPAGSTFDQIATEHVAARYNLDSLEDLRHVTVGDVMENANLQRQIGERQFRTLSEASELGLINERTVLHRNRNVRGLYTTPEGFIQDTRWATAGNALRGLYTATRNFSVAGFRPVELFAGMGKAFTQGEFFGELGVGTVIGRGRKITAQDGISFAMGGNIYRQQRGGFQHAGSGFKLFSSKEGQSAGLMESFQAIMGMHPLQSHRVAQISQAEADAHPVRDFWQQLQDLVGVGPGFKTRPHVAETFVVYPMRRRQAGRMGGGYVPYSEAGGALAGRQGVGFGYVSRRDQRRGFFEKVVNQLQGLNESDAVAARADESRGFMDRVARTMGVDSGDELSALYGNQQRGAFLSPAGMAEFRRSGTIRGQSLVVQRPTTAASYGTRPARFHTGEVGEASYGRATGRTTVRNYVVHDGGVLGNVNLVGTYMTTRLNNLLSATLNYGIRPGSGSYGWVGNIAKIYGGYQAINMGLDYLSYADYLMEEYTGVSPKKWGLKGYIGLRTGLQKAREVTGVTSAADWIEDTMPGSVDSPLSQALRFAGPMAATFLRGRGPGLSGLAAGTFLGYGDIQKSSEDVYDELIGDKDVAYRRGRWWMLGRQPFGGGPVEFYGKSWIARQLSDYQYTDSLYGSKQEYWRHVNKTPTPSNLFNLFESPEEYLSQKHYYTRPYPVDADGSPARMSEAIFNELPEERDVIPDAGARLGLQDGGTHHDRRAIVGPYGAGGKLGYYADKISELSGIYKFALWDLPGFSNNTDNRRLASPEAMASRSREFYDNSMGGMLGLSEAYRRFLPDEKFNKDYNPIPNQMPDWLPGIRSSFEKDRRYYMDFTLGDPYTKVKQGEARLPGEGYERMHRLHSGAHGTYDAMDRFLILADVAPYSQSYQHYKAIVSSWAKAGVLDSYWSEKFDTAQKQVKDKLQQHDFTHRRFTGLVTAPEEEMERVEQWNPLRRSVAAAWEVATHDVVSRAAVAVPFAGGILGNKLAPTRSPIEAYQKWELYGEDFADWRTPYKSFIRPMAHELTASDPATATFGGAMLGVFGANPLSRLVFSGVGAALAGTASTARAVGTGEMTGGYIPSHREEEREAKEYLDKLKYVKYRRLQQIADAQGDRTLAYQYKKMAGRTLTGMDYSLPQAHFQAAARAAMGKRERGYFDAFTEVTDPESRKRILEMVPEYMKQVYVAAWSKQGDPRMRAAMREMQQSGDARAAEYFRNVRKPDSTWAGWHPSVSQSDIAIRLANQEALDIHRFNLWEEQVSESEARFPDLHVPVDLSDIQRTPSMLRHAALDTSRKQYRAASFTGGGFTAAGLHPEGIELDVIPDTVTEALRYAGSLLQ